MKQGCKVNPYLLSGSNCLTKKFNAKNESKNPKQMHDEHNKINS